MLSFISLVLVALLCSVNVLAGHHHIRRSTGPVVEDQYIVVLKPDADRSAHIEQVSTIASISSEPDSISIKHQYSKALHGYSAKLKGAALAAVLADPNVAYITEDAISSISYTKSSRSSLPSSGPAVIDAFGRRTTQATNGTDGLGVDVYGIDTGIYIEHNDFGGRASWGATFGDGYADADGNGHGTHTASTAVGAQYGYAKAANVIAVKVLADDGNGPNSEIIAGIEWVMNAAIASGKPSVANMSLSSGQDDAMDQAVRNAIAAGVHFCVAAGNASADADGSSPARVPEANTIGAVDSSNQVASFSNFGPDLDVYALGVDVTAAWIGGPDSTNTISGTSMASPRVAGFLAVALGKRGKTAPADLSSALTNNAQPIVEGQPANTTDLLAEKFS